MGATRGHVSHGHQCIKILDASSRSKSTSKILAYWLIQNFIPTSLSPAPFHKTETFLRHLEKRAIVEIRGLQGLVTLRSFWSFGGGFPQGSSPNPHLWRREKWHSSNGFKWAVLFQTLKQDSAGLCLTLNRGCLKIPNTTYAVWDFIKRKTRFGIQAMNHSFRATQLNYWYTNPNIQWRCSIDLPSFKGIVSSKRVFKGMLSWYMQGKRTAMEYLGHLFRDDFGHDTP